MKRKKTVVVKPTTPLPTPIPARRPVGNRFVQWAASLWVIFHFTAVVAAAASVGPTSGLIIAIWRPFRPYLQALYLNHGYSFYAPEPSPSTLVSYQVKRDDGTVVRGRILDRATRPRLLYHRYLLLTEHMGLAPSDSLEEWYKSYARHLCRKYGGSKVGFTRVIHYPATTEMIRDGGGLDEPFSYEEMFVGEFQCSEL